MRQDGFFPHIVSFQMSPQIARIRECKFKLVAFLQLLYAVHFQMILQRACILC